MKENEQLKRDRYAERVERALGRIQAISLEKNKSFSVSGVIEELKEMGFEFSNATFSRIRKADKSASLIKYAQLISALDAYLNQYSYAYHQPIENYVKISEPQAGSPTTGPSTRKVIDATYQSFPLEVIKKNIQEAQYEILFLQSFFSFLKDIKDELQFALRQGVTVKILLFDPQSDLVDRRIEELEGPQGATLLDTSFENIKTLQELNNTFATEGRFQVRFLQKESSLNLIKIDHVIYQGFYWTKTIATEGPWEKKSAGGIMGQGLLRHFEALWNAYGVEAELMPKPNRTAQVEIGDLTDNAQETISRSFRCYYYHRLRTRQFILNLASTIIEEGQRQIKAGIILSESQSTYDGQLREYQLEQNYMLAGELTENSTNPGACRTAYISMLMENQGERLEDRRMISGTIATQDMQKNILLCSRMILIRLDNYEVKQPQIIPLRELERRTGISKGYIQTFIQQNYMEVSQARDITTYDFGVFNESSLDKRLIIKDIAGHYELYSIIKESYEIRVGHLQIESNSVLWTPGLDVEPREGKTARPQKIYQCNVEVIGEGLIFIRTDKSLGGPKFFAVLKYSPDEPNILKGTYTGFKKKAQGAFPLEPRAGRIFALRKSDVVEGEEGYAEVESHLLDSEPRALDWFDHSVQAEMEEKWPNFRHFFNGLDNLYLEDPNQLSRKREWVRFEEGDDISPLIGKYDWFYKSSAEREKGGIRKLMLEVKLDGDVQILDKYGQVIHGNIFRYGRYIHIRKFYRKSELNVEESINPQIKNAPIDFQGLFVLYMTDYKEGRPAHKMEGILTEYSRRKEPLARKVVLLRANKQVQENQEITNVKPTVIPLSRIKLGFPEDERAIFEALRNEPFYYIKTKAQDETKHVTQKSSEVDKLEDFRIGFYQAAVQFANDKNYNAALKYLELAIRYGLTSNDHNLIRDREEGGVFHRIDKMIHALFR